MQIKVQKLRSNAKLPTFAHNTDSGADVYACIDVRILKGKTAKIPLGIALEIPYGVHARIVNKSGLSSKGLLISNAPIDSGYSGEVHAIVTNVSASDKEWNQSYTFSVGDKVGQLVFDKMETNITFAEDIVKGGERGQDGFGSTGK